MVSIFIRKILLGVFSKVIEPETMILENFVCLLVFPFVDAYLKNGLTDLRSEDASAVQER